MKFGVKSYFEESFFDYFSNNADFFEVEALREKNYDFLKKYSLPFVVHAEHFIFGSNPADKKNFKENLESLNYARKIADSVKCEKIILHPGILANKNCSKENAIEFIKNIDDDRILIENLRFGKEGWLCQTPEEIKEFLKETGKGFIFDLAHALISANHYKKNYIRFINKFLELKPSHFHISGQMLNIIDDEHKALTECDLPFDKFLRMFPEDAKITLEVSRDIKKIEEDLKFIRTIAKNL